MQSRPALIAILLAITGCTIEQKVKPIAISPTETHEICVIANTAVRPEFLEAYKNALAKRNLAVRTLPQGTAVDACPLTSTYTANWRWDLALYLAYANFKVYRNGHLEGEAIYDSLSGGANMGKFIDAEKKVQELADQLFPG